MSTKSPLDKADMLFKMFVWTQVLIITVAICIPGIIISLQYSGDQCVVGKLWNVRLDEWLLIASMVQLVSIISFLPTVCCVWKHWCSKLIPLSLILILLLCLGLGIFLMAVSDLSACGHDSLFVMSVIEIIFIGIFITVYSVVQIRSYFSCNCCNISDSDNNDLYTDDEEDLSWFRKKTMDAFTV